jgi:hypothetical protein
MSTRRWWLLVVAEAVVVAVSVVAAEVVPGGGRLPLCEDIATPAISNRMWGVRSCVGVVVFVFVVLLVVR